MDPLVRRSLTFGRRSPGWSATIAVCVAALALARATAPLVSDAAADRSFTAEATSSVSGSPAGLGLDARAYTTGLADAAVALAVSAALDGLSVYGPPVVSVSPLLPYDGHDHPTPVIRTLDGRQEQAVVFSLADSASSLETTSPAAGGGSATGIWVPDTVALRLGIGPGDAVVLGLDFPDFAPKPDRIVDARTTVAGVYATAGGLPASPTFDWRSPPVPLPRDPSGGARTPPLLLADAGTAMELIAAMNDRPFVRWDLEWTGPASVERGRSASDEVQRLADELVDDESLIGRRVADARAPAVVLSSGVQTFVQHSQDAAALLRPVLDSIALTAQIMSLLVLVTCTWLLARQRRREHALSLTMGAGPLRLGVLGALEQAVPIAAGVAAAYVVVRWFPGLVAGGGSIDAATLARATRPVLWALPLAVVTIAGAGAAAVWPMDAASAGRARRVAGALRPETIVVVAAVGTGAQLATQKGSALDSGTSLLFPLFAVLASSSVVVRSAASVVRARSSRRVRRGASTATRPRSLVVWLARRRVSHGVTELSALAILVAAGVGLFTYGASITADGRQGIRDKAAAIGGAPATAEIDGAADVPRGLDGWPAGLRVGAAVVWRFSGAQMAPKVVADLLAVDPHTFGAAASWRDSFAARSFESLLADVADADAPTVDVVVAGNYTSTFPDHGTMSLEFGSPPIRYRVVARIAAGPWLRDRSSVAIVSARALAPLLPAGRGSRPVDDIARLERLFSTYVWSQGSQTELEAALGPALIEADVPNVATARRLPSFVAFDQSLPYLGLVGSALLVVALGSIVVLGARRRTELALELALTDAMGLPRRTMAAAVVGAAVLLGLLASLVGLGIARLLVGFMLGRLDPVPRVPPAFAGSLSPAAVVVSVVAVVAVSVVAASIELRLARRVRIPEVLRGAE